MVYNIWYISLGLWYIPVESGIYRDYDDDATFQMLGCGRGGHIMMIQIPNWSDFTESLAS